jgi:hypothetical protein
MLVIIDFETIIDIYYELYIYSLLQHSLILTLMAREVYCSYNQRTES